MSTLIPDPTDSTVFILGEHQTIVNVHNRRLCKGKNCVIHNPSDHHMKDWPLVWRDDRHFFERICPHGIGHPDFDDYLYHNNRGINVGIHACDLCCTASMDAVVLEDDK